ncbi:TPA: transglycosylase [Escherichia coli]|nr:transglycosylase [Escherichia coli]
MILNTNQQKLVFAWGVVLLVVRTTNLLSLFVEWVKLFPDDVTRGEKMASDDLPVVYKCDLRGW